MFPLLQEKQTMTAALYKRISAFSSLVKISHTIFSLPFAVIGFFLALQHQGSTFELKTFVLMLLCVFFARNAAMSFNRIADRHIDRENPRTQQRDLPTGKISLPYANFFLAVNIVLFIATTYFLNFLCFCLSPLALLVILGYSYTKRFTWLSHFVLGLGLAMAPTGAYLAVTAHFHYIPLLYSLAVLCWVSGFDIIYALSDINFDKKQGLHSIPERFGITASLVFSLLLHCVSMLVIIAAGIANHQGWYFWAGTAIFAALLFYQHYMVRPHDLSRVNFAFFTLNGLSGLILLLFFLLDFFLLI